MTPDETLLSSWRSGDRSAGVQLIERHYDAIVRFFETKAGPDADDLVQRTFLRFSEQIGAYAATGSLRAYLFGIARNVLFEHLRHKVRNGRSTDFDALSIADLQPGVSTQAAQRADSRMLVQALQRIPIESQVLVELYYWEELPVGELAELLEIPPGTVKSRLHRARAQLKDALAAVPDLDDDPRSVRLQIAAWLEGLPSD